MNDPLSYSYCDDHGNACCGDRVTFPWMWKELHPFGNDDDDVNDRP